jgi:hypothetical protein
MQDICGMVDEVSKAVGKGKYDVFKTRGWFDIVSRNKLGFIKEGRIVRNTVTNTGKGAMASRFNGAGSEAAFTYLALGTGATAAAAGDTALGTEISTSGLARANATASRVTTTQTNDTAQAQYTWTASGSVSPTECGIFNASSVGVMAARQVFTAIPLVNTDSFQLTYKVQFT